MAINKTRTGSEQVGQDSMQAMKITHYRDLLHKLTYQLPGSNYKRRRSDVLKAIVKVMGLCENNVRSAGGAITDLFEVRCLYTQELGVHGYEIITRNKHIVQMRNEDMDAWKEFVKREG